MSADLAAWRVQAAESWKLSLPCTRAEAEALGGDIPAFDALDPPPVLMTSEPDPSRPDEWRLDVYFEGEPDSSLVGLVRALVPSAQGPAAAERIEDADWVTVSQRWLEPIRAGRFYVHTAAHGQSVPADAIAFHIEASRAFGTGHHETTTGCLTMLDRLATSGARFAKIADIGTGTGLLAFAARALWPAARVIASDIDPVSVEVATENMVINGIPKGAIALVVAAGMADPRLRQSRHDLIVANILAGPLVDLASDFADAVVDGGSVMLAGLLAAQATDVVAAYEACGFRLADRLDLGDWPTLRMERVPEV